MNRLELILIRHGETDWNKQLIFRGLMDVRLNARGIAQADATADALKDRVFEAVYSSSLKRAVVTARRIAKPHEMEIRVNESFTDIDFGILHGKNEEEVESRYPVVYKRWMEHPGRTKFPGGESVKKAWKRVVGGLREVIFTHGTGTVVIVSHRVPIKMMTAYLTGKSRHDLNEIRHDPCAISIFDVQHRTYRPVVLNETKHLRELRSEPTKDF